MNDHNDQRQQRSTDTEQNEGEDTEFVFTTSDQDAEVDEIVGDVEEEFGTNQAEEDQEDVTLDRVEEVVTEEFDTETWNVTEAIISARATLLIDQIEKCTGLIIVGASGAGKSTALRIAEGSKHGIEKRDDITPASFASLEPSSSEEDLEDSDLLPQIKHKTLINSDMATWFSGEQSTIRSRMARMARVMDGRGLIRHGGGGHGKRGYNGDYRFTFIGATTPLSPRAWDVMGHTGQRFVFHEMQSDDEDLETVREDIFGGNDYSESIRKCQDVVDRFTQQLWAENDGVDGVSNFGSTDDAQRALTYLGQVIKYSRATLRKNDNAEWEIEAQENLYRVVSILRDIARGRALLDGKTKIECEHVRVSARVALSTMPKKRRPLVRLVLDPSVDEIEAADVDEALGTTRPTSTDRMEKLCALGIADWVDTDDGRGKLAIEPASGFEWPDGLNFPEFDSS